MIDTIDPPDPPSTSPAGPEPLSETTEPPAPAAPDDVTPPIAALIASIRAAVVAGASAEMRAAGATACRSLLTVPRSQAGPAAGRRTATPGVTRIADRSAAQAAGSSLPARRNVARATPRPVEAGDRDDGAQTRQSGDGRPTVSPHRVATARPPMNASASADPRRRSRACAVAPVMRMSYICPDEAAQGHIDHRTVAAGDEARRRACGRDREPLAQPDGRGHPPAVPGVAP